MVENKGVDEYGSVQEVQVPGFTHLRTVSGFSLRYGASHPERLAERAAERGMDALALTDRDTLAGAIRFARACEKAGVRPLFGVELAVGPAAAEHTGEGGRTHLRFVSAMAGVLGVGGDLTAWSEEELAEARTWV
ncbi:PHP domain-containing protein, partial [Streptomyces sp. NPDC088184]|uniref:PHP domain-containing protein n=1 Tax=Streptomyces sp. NPDC088184 TaxID=3160991 RepID=UPI00341AE113